MKSLALLTLSLLIPNVALPQEKFAVAGAGTVSCGKFLEHQENPAAREAQITWLQGFLSGMNMADPASEKNMLLLPDAETIQLYLTNYCRDNPLELPVGGAMRLYRELRSRDRNNRSEP